MLAGKTLGLRSDQIFRLITLPQMIRVIIPPTGNEFIAMIKDTALLSLTASAIFWYDIFKRAQVVGSRDYRNLEALIVTAGIYWMLTAIFTFFQSRLEARVSKGYVREGAAPSKAGRTKIVTGARVGSGAIGVAMPDPGAALQDERDADLAALQAERDRPAEPTS
jgi:polar amino acid transport system permease protein